MKSTLSLLAVLLSLSVPASAIEWQAMGARAVGMGGAGVALTQGPLASYWNPAALGRATENSYGVAVPVGVHVALTGTVIEGANNLKNVTDACTALDTTLCTTANITDALNRLNDPANGLRINANVGGDFKVGKIAVFTNQFLVMGAVPQMDVFHNDIDPLLPATYVVNNTSALIVKGARIMEIGAGYGRELPFAPGVFLGGNLKIMNAQVGYTSYRININNNNDSNILKSLKDGAKTSSNFGVDLGALWDIKRSFAGAWGSPRVGLVGRNLNNPKFSQPATATAAGLTSKFAVNPQIRLGGSISLTNWWHIASDVDLTNNLTPVDGVSSRQFGLGTEVNVFNRSWINIPLRFGIARNLANSASGTMMTAGAGINLLHLMLDVSGQYSPQTIQTQSQGKSTKIPKELGVAIQLSVLFGGSKNDLGPVSPDREWKAAPKADEQAVPTEKIRAAAEKAQQALDAESAKPADAAKTSEKK